MEKKYFLEDMIINNSPDKPRVSADNIADLIEDYTNKLMAGEQPDRNDYFKQYTGQKMDELDEQLQTAELLVADGIDLRKEVEGFLTEQRVREAKEKLFQ